MKTQTCKRLGDLVVTYNRTTKVMEHGAAKAIKEDGRAYGGFVRAAKGKLQEYITEELIQIAWEVELAKDPKKLSINSDKIRIPIRLEYVESIRNRAVKDYILSNIQRYYYGLSVDKHVFVDGKMILGIECKACTENAMIKRILVDFHLLKTKVPNLLCYLFQLESQLGRNGNGPVTALMSHFPSADLNIVTLFHETKAKRAGEYNFSEAMTVEKLEKMMAVLVAAFQHISRN